MKKSIYNITKDRLRVVGPYDISAFGIYKDGMTDKEVKIYLEYRNQIHVLSGRKKIDNAYSKLCKLSNGGTGGSATCPCCKRVMFLMYRNDVERFVDQIFNGTKTYFD